MINQTILESNQYLSLAIDKVSLVLSFQNREALYKTYGCFDRNYWCWKFTDFPSARFQEGIYSLALFYCNQFEGNYLFKKEKVLPWILAGMDYWAKIQYKDGSFDEAYPYEHSLGATSFTSFYVGEAFLLLSDKIPDELREKLIDTFRRAGDWLCQNDERHGVLSNHLAAAAAGVYNIYLITGEEKYRDRCNYFLNRVYKHQSGEGWFEEYGGADPGYQTYCTFFLARIWQHTKDNELLNKLKRSIEFLSYFIHPDHTIGGEYGSRDTEFYFPAGLEILAGEIQLAAEIAQFMREAVKLQPMVGLSAMDSYNFFPMLNNYIFSGLNIIKPIVSDGLPFRKKFEKYFEDAKIYIKSSDYYYSILGVSKGGVLKVFDKRRKELTYSDCGYWGRSKKGKIVSSQSLDINRKATPKDNKVKLTTKFSKVGQKVFNPFLFIGFRFVTLFLGKFSFWGYLVKRILVKALIYKKGKITCSLLREVEFEEHEIKIIDKIIDLDKAKLVFLTRGDKFTTIHMGSSKYFQRNELIANAFESDNLLAKLKDKKEKTLTCTVDIF